MKTSLTWGLVDRPSHFDYCQPLPHNSSSGPELLSGILCLGDTFQLAGMTMYPELRNEPHDLWSLLTLLLGQLEFSRTGIPKAVLLTEQFSSVETGSRSFCCRVNNCMPRGKFCSYFPCPPALLLLLSPISVLRCSLQLLRSDVGGSCRDGCSATSIPEHLSEPPALAEGVRNSGKSTESTGRRQSLLSPRTRPVLWAQSSL